LDRVINALGIPYVGSQTAVILSKHYFSLDALSCAREEELLAIEGIGEKTASAICDFFLQEDVKRLIERLSSLGVGAKREERRSEFFGKNVVITGSLPTLSRSEAEELLRNAGAVPASSVSKKTDLLICGKEPGSKLQKAESLNIKIMNGEEFEEKIKYMKKEALGLSDEKREQIEKKVFEVAQSLKKRK
jgi:DNA ligase (NAD+)